MELREEGHIKYKKALIKTRELILIFNVAQIDLDTKEKVLFKSLNSIIII